MENIRGYRGLGRVGGIYSPTSFPPDPSGRWVSQIRVPVPVQEATPHHFPCPGSGLCSLFLPLSPGVLTALPILTQEDSPIPYDFPTVSLSHTLVSSPLINSLWITQIKCVFCFQPEHQVVQGIRIPFPGERERSKILIKMDETYTSLPGLED